MLRRCTVCEEAKATGIRLYTTFICAGCEHNMVHTDVREVKYLYYVEKLKNIHAETLHSSK